MPPGIDINPRRGDNGMDIIDTHIDVKNSFSLSRYIKSMPQVVSYTLPVPKDEYHQDWVYVSALSEIMDENLLVSYLIGWAWASELYLETEGTFKNKFIRKNNELRNFPLPNIFPPRLHKYIKEGTVEGV